LRNLFIGTRQKLSTAQQFVGCPRVQQARRTHRCHAAHDRSDNGVPFASPNALFNLSKLSAWLLRLGIEDAIGLAVRLIGATAVVLAPEARISMKTCDNDDAQLVYPVSIGAEAKSLQIRGAGEGIMTCTQESAWSIR
jgi:hypothetical protein